MGADMNSGSVFPATVRTRLITEFVNKRDEILAQRSPDELPPQLAERLQEIDMMLEGLAAQQPCN